MSLQPRPPHELARDLHALRIAAGDALMVHGSLRRIGPVAGGGPASELVEAAGLVEDAVPWMAAHLAPFAGRPSAGPASEPDLPVSRTCQ